ncbi:hypothetical protein CTAYLR_009655 [Chrysophaeum taylorii]|uniref:Helicase ATP-binding domain-containing protein n=1 Tax=Chrysophaeum taylorii TaxID=2483200 RepID=A0AAD7UJR8_9STRA|nr:hypothetical protein CTAYLR_009655 [Chrysophaeum taylorii]
MGKSKGPQAVSSLEEELKNLSIAEAQRRQGKATPARKKAKTEKKAAAAAAADYEFEFYVKYGYHDDEGDETAMPPLHKLPCEIDESRSKRVIPMNGVSVHFPFKEPLVPQRQVMLRVVQAVLKKECALLESPTGTGKTQALLSASLAAQRHLMERGDRVGIIIFATRTIGQMRQLPDELRKNPYRAISAPLASRVHYCTNEAVNNGRSNAFLTQECRKRANHAEHRIRNKKDANAEGKNETSAAEGKEEEEEEDKACTCEHYWALTSNVHASKAHRAARPAACEKKKSKTGLVDIEDLAGVANINDLRDLAGKEGGLTVGGCAYFTARVLAMQSHIIFLTYNYLMSPAIRKAIGLDDLLESAIVIVDEAHNVEQCARDGGSISISLFQMYDLEVFLLTRLDGLKKKVAEIRKESGEDDNDFTYSGDKITQLVRVVRHKLEEAETAFGDEEEPKSQAKFSLSERIKFKRPPDDRDVVRGYDWGAGGKRPSSEQFFVKFDLDEDLIKSAYADAVTIAEGARELDDDSFMYGDQCVELASLFQMCYANKGHYAICVNAWYNEASAFKQSFDGRKKSDGGGDDDDDDEYHQQQQLIATPDGRMVPVWGFELSLMLLHPGVIMDGLAKSVRCLVLASGTLSPIDKTQHELGDHFTERMKRDPLVAKHVVCTKNQVAVRAVTSANDTRSGRPVDLECTSRNLNNGRTQEGRMMRSALGNTVVSLASTAPGGVLVFFPSHKLLDNLVNFWKTQSNWHSLERAKHTILIENKDAVENDKIIASYREAIAGPHKSAVLLCAFRAKCSEGISFNDDFCRLVICIGIPYPPVYDILVTRKKDYNNAKIQGGAELGLPKALGRCIRHLNDYGAIVLCDARFRDVPSRSHVAAWLRDAIECGSQKRREYRERMGLPPRTPSKMTAQQQSQPMNVDTIQFTARNLVAISNRAAMEGKVRETARESEPVPPVTRATRSEVTRPSPTSATPPTPPVPAAAAAATSVKPDNKEEMAIFLDASSSDDDDDDEEDA